MSVLSAALALAPRRGAAHSFEALLDPQPMAVRPAQIATHLAPTLCAAARRRRIGERHSADTARVLATCF